jgi:hypothetical protein
VPRVRVGMPSDQQIHNPTGLRGNQFLPVAPHVYCGVNVRFYYVPLNREVQVDDEGLLAALVDAGATITYIEEGA